MIGWIVGEVKQQKLYDSTTVVFWTDHGCARSNSSTLHLWRCRCILNAGVSQINLVNIATASQTIEMGFLNASPCCLSWAWLPCEQGSSTTITRTPRAS